MPTLVENKRQLITCIVLLLALMWSPLIAKKKAPSLPKPFFGVVTYIYDGDTLEVKKERKSYTVRIPYIDAPELFQAYGQNARNCLQNIVYYKQVFVRPLYYDNYKRLIAVVQINKNDVHTMMVKHGCAWQDPQYSKSMLLEKRQKFAKKHEVGLWKNHNAIPPWTFRKRYR